jgi:hypothetical protein
MIDAVRRFFRDDSAQELAEYAFLSLFIGLAGLLLWPVVVNLIASNYEDANDDVQQMWEPPSLP